VGRDPERLERTRTELVAWSGNHEVAPYQADLGSLAAVRAAATAILEREPRLDVLVDNAGGIHGQRRVSPEGFELSFATMVLGPFVLTSRLLPLLTRSASREAPSRIVAVTSGAMYAQGLHLDDLQYALDPYDGTLAYARAKRAQIVLVREWARRLRGRWVTANVAHPGWTDTPGLEASLPAFREFLGPYARTPEEGVDTIVWLAASDEARGRTGRLFLDRRVRPFDRLPMTRVSTEDRRALWDRVVALTGEAPELD
jgi:NAD(P)-dependent dehydrogenase (short-subunit alcohol dehydrogenase family)